MAKNRYLHLSAATVLLASALLACSLGGGGATAPGIPKAAVAPITIGSDLTAVDLCAAIPREDIETLLGRKLAVAPARFDYYGTGGTSGCTYDGGKDSNGDAHYAYVVLTPVDVYNTQPLHLNVDVSGLGQSAYFNNGADARQLWVKINDQYAFVVANGDIEYEAGMKAMAELLVAAIK